MPSATTQRFRVIQTDDETEQQTPIGEVDAGPDGKLTLVSVVPDKQEFLTDLIEEMNGKDQMHKEAQPPPNARPHALYSIIIPRSDPRFFDAMKDFLSKYYDVTLTPA